MAHSKTYTFTGPTWPVLNDFTSCATGPCADFPVGSRMIGHFSTAVPLPSNLPATNIFPQITSFSFNDGVDTYSSSDPNVRVYEFTVGTDAAGNIIVPQDGISLSLWLSGSSPHAVGDRMAFGHVDMANTSATHNNSCDVITNSPITGVTDLCIAGNIDASTSSASGGGPGIWQPPNVPVATIPTLSRWSLVMLTLLTGVIGFCASRRRQGHAAAPRAICRR
jgi:hypothetical protein